VELRLRLFEVGSQHHYVTEVLRSRCDITSFKDPRTGERVRIEHWRTAQQQGRAAARNMLGRDIAFEGVPFFWTRQFDVALLYVGHAKSWDEIIYRGDVLSHDFLAFYLKGDRVLAVAGMNRDRDMAIIEDLLRHNNLSDAAELKLAHGSGAIYARR